MFQDRLNVDGVPVRESLKGGGEYREAFGCHWVCESLANSLRVKRVVLGVEVSDPRGNLGKDFDLFTHQGKDGVESFGFAE